MQQQLEMLADEPRKLARRKKPEDRIRKSYPEVQPGAVFGRLTVLRYEVNEQRGKRKQWLCDCSCGARHYVDASSVATGHTVSCGCYSRDETSARTFKHGHSAEALPSPTYQTWRHMRRRCHAPRDDSFPGYGGKGIKVCDRWLNSFEAFLSDMGERPPGMTLDRWPDKAGNYEPGNCRWATKDQQAQNTSRAKLTPESAAQIRALQNTGHSARSIGRQFGVSYHRVRAIWAGTAWRAES